MVFSDKIIKPNVLKEVMKISIDGSVTNSQIQQGVVNSKQEMNMGFQTALLNLDMLIREQLKDTLEFAEIEPILEENEKIASDEQNRPIIRKNLTRLKSIIGNIGTSAVASGILEVIKEFMVTWAL